MDESTRIDREPKNGRPPGPFDGMDAGFGISMPTMRAAWPMVLAALTLAQLVVAGCGGGRVPAWFRSWAVKSQGSDRALLAEADAAFAKRKQPRWLRAAIAAWEKALVSRPTHIDTYARLARAYFLLAESVYAIEAAKDERSREPMLAAYERGLTFAERGLWLSSEPFRERLAAGALPGDAAAVLGKGAVPLLYWFAVNLGKWSRGRGLLATAYHRHCVRKIMLRIIAVDRGYWYGGADRYLGAYYAFKSSLTGGDLVRSRAHFDAALRVAPQHLGTRVLMAEIYYGKRQRDSVHFVATLKGVLAASTKSIPGLEPEQWLAQRRAHELLKQADEFFF